MSEVTATKSTTSRSKSSASKPKPAPKKPADRKPKTPTRRQRSDATKKVQRAVAETAQPPEGARSVEWEGLTLEVPQDLPAEILFDFVEMEASGFDPLPLLRICRSLVGPVQFLSVRQRVQELGSGLDVALNALNTILDGYGVSLGESPASADS